jgi:hypothetical protein
VITSHFLELTVDGGAGYDHFGDVGCHVINGVAAKYCQVGLVGFPDMSNAKSFVDAFVNSDPQEYFATP